MRKLKKIIIKNNTEQLTARHEECIYTLKSSKKQTRINSRAVAASTLGLTDAVLA